MPKHWFHFPTTLSRTSAVKVANLAKMVALNKMLRPTMMIRWNVELNNQCEYLNISRNWIEIHIHWLLFWVQQLFLSVARYFYRLKQNHKYKYLKKLNWNQYSIQYLIVILGAAAVSLSCQILTFSGSGNNIARHKSCMVNKWCYWCYWKYAIL